MRRRSSEEEGQRHRGQEMERNRIDLVPISLSKKGLQRGQFCPSKCTSLYALVTSGLS